MEAIRYPAVRHLLRIGSIVLLILIACRSLALGTFSCLGLRCCGLGLLAAVAVLHVNHIAALQSIHRDGNGILRGIQDDDAVHVHAGEQVAVLGQRHGYRIVGNAVGGGTLHGNVGYLTGEGLIREGVCRDVYSLAHLHIGDVQLIDVHLEGNSGQVIDHCQGGGGISVLDLVAHLCVLGHHGAGNRRCDGVVVQTVVCGIYIVLGILEVALCGIHLVLIGIQNVLHIRSIQTEERGALGHIVTLMHEKLFNGGFTGEVAGVDAHVLCRCEAGVAAGADAVDLRRCGVAAGQAARIRHLYGNVSHHLAAGQGLVHGGYCHNRALQLLQCIGESQGCRAAHRDLLCIRRQEGNGRLHNGIVVELCNFCICGNLLSCLHLQALDIAGGGGLIGVAGQLRRHLAVVLRSGIILLLGPLQRAVGQAHLGIHRGGVDPVHHLSLGHLVALLEVRRNDIALRHGGDVVGVLRGNGAGGRQ